MEELLPFLVNRNSGVRTVDSKAPISVTINLIVWQEKIIHPFFDCSSHRTANGAILIPKAWGWRDSRMQLLRNPKLKA